MLDCELSCEQQTSMESKIQRSQPIPKEVNKFMLKYYGESYYNSHDIFKRNEILKAIVDNLRKAGYNSISAMEVERRLKNMKSHYRRKKADIQAGLVPSVEWEYFKTLDSIFTATDSFAFSEMNNEIRKTTQQKRKAEQQVEPDKNNEMPCDMPQDLSIKRPKVIEFNQKSDITSQISIEPRVRVEPCTETPHDTQSNDSSTVLILKIIESIKTVDMHRLQLDRERLAMEVRRYELDVVGYQLSELLYKITHPVPSNVPSDSAGN